MCGRFSLTFSSKDLRDHFLVEEAIITEPRYNIAPSQDVLAIRVEEGKRLFVFLHWGLIPFWAKDRKISYRTINARAETAFKTPSFRAAFRSRRCLIPASGFYEWDKKSGSRQPYFIHRTDEKPMAFAGLWEHWEDPKGGDTVESCTILTTDATEPVSDIHNRMPVILEPENFDCWLVPETRNLQRLHAILQPIAPGIISMRPVSKYVNKAGNEGERCILTSD